MRKLWLNGIACRILDERVSMVVRSPLFRGDGNDGSFLFNFGVYCDVDLRRALGYAGRPSARGKQYRADAIFQFGGMTVGGVARVTGVEGDEVQVSLPIYNSSLASLLRPVRLPELDMGADIKTWEHIAEGNIGLSVMGVQGIMVWKFGSAAVGGHVEGPLGFYGNVVDPDGLWLDGNKRFVAPEAGAYTMIFSLSMNMFAGTDFVFQVRRNGNLWKEYEITLIPPPEWAPERPWRYVFDQTESNFVFDHLDLNAHDHLEFFLSCQPFYDSGLARINYILRNETSIGLYHRNLVWENTLQDYPITQYNTFPIRNDQFFRDAPSERYLIGGHNLGTLGEQIPVLNYVERGQMPMMMVREREGVKYTMFNTIVPLPYVSGVVRALLAKKGIVIDGDNPFDGIDQRDLLLVVQRSINKFADNALNTMAYEFNLKDVLPDESGAVFFFDICDTLGIAYDYDSVRNRLRLVLYDDILASKESDDWNEGMVGGLSLVTDDYNELLIRYRDPSDSFWSSNARSLDDVNYKGVVADYGLLPLTGNRADDCYYVTFDGAYYHWSYDRDEELMGWVFYSGDFLPSFRRVFFDFAGGGVLERELPVAPLLMQVSPATDPTYDASERSWRIGASGFGGSMEGLPPPEVFYGLMFYRGRVMDSDGYAYPLGSNDLDDGEMSLHLNDNVGSLFMQRHQKMWDWLAKGEGTWTGRRVMRATELGAIDLLRWKNIGGTDFMIKELRADIGDDDHVEVEVDLVSRNAREQVDVPYVPEAGGGEPGDPYAAIDGNCFEWQGKTYCVIVKNGLAWLDRNLGATEVANQIDHNAADGNYYQWGRFADGHELTSASSITELSNEDIPGHSLFICRSLTNDWRSPSNDNLWQGVNGINNPCPPGWRLPTQSELNTERLSWSENTNVGAINSNLRWACGGSRSAGGTVCNSIYAKGTIGLIASSTIMADGRSRYLYFSSNNANVTDNTVYTARILGKNIRAVRDLE